MLPFLPDAKAPTGSILKRAALIFLPIAVALSVVIALAVRIDAKFRSDIVELREQARVDLASEQIAQDFDEIGSDLRMIANLPSLRSYLNTGTPASRDAVTTLLLQLSREKHRYDQIRYLDNRGREQIRVNFNNGSPSIVPQAELQDKSDRYYFRDAIKLDRGDVYVSPLDLNMEHGQLELPQKPMIRFATPVFDSAGHKRGVLLFNYQGKQLLQKFREIMGGTEHNAMLLNREGYWMINADPGNEWGFMLGRKDLTFGHQFPAEWRIISTRESGNLDTARGLFVYKSVYPLLSNQHVLSGGQEQAAHAYRWEVVAYIPREVLAADSFFNQPSIIALLGMVYVLLAIAAWIIAMVALTRKQARLALVDSNARYDELARSIPVGVYQFRFHANGSYAFEYVSPVFCEILGVRAALVLADAGVAFAAAHPDDAEDLTKANREAATSLQPFRWEGRFIVQGAIRWLKIASEPTQRGDWGSLWSGVVTDITDQKALEQELARQAHIDMLTGLSNRRHFFDLAEKELARARRHHEPFAVLMLDVDHFKQVNDSYGHDVGDMVLRQMGEVCAGVLRANDILARLGGEEFAIVLPETVLEPALETAERLRLALAASAVALADGSAIHFTVSIGAACLTATDENVDAILKRADAALYAAKHAGRNRVRTG